MGKGRKKNNSACNNFAKPTFTDIEDEPKFIELPDDYETEEEIQRRKKLEELEIKENQRKIEEEKRARAEKLKADQEKKLKEKKQKEETERNLKEKKRIEEQEKKLKEKREKEELEKKLKENKQKEEEKNLKERKRIEEQEKGEKEELKKKEKNYQEKKLKEKGERNLREKKMNEEQEKVLKEKQEKEKLEKTSNGKKSREKEEKEIKEKEEAKKKEPQAKKIEVKGNKARPTEERNKGGIPENGSKVDERTGKEAKENTVKENKPKEKEESEAKVEQGNEMADERTKEDKEKGAKAKGDQGEGERGREKKDQVKTENQNPEIQNATNKKQTSEEVEKLSTEEKKPQGDCIVCGHLAKSFCSNCKFVFYCKRDHQRSHWRSHKEDCKAFGSLPYRIERNDLLGRHLVAKVDIPAGTLITNELPMIVGPRQLTKPVCLGCHKEIVNEKGKWHPCSRCHWPVCSQKCQDSPMHEPECRIIRYGGTKVKMDNFGQINMMYACITVLRALALKTGPQEVWKDYTNFQSHLENRMKTEIYTKVNKEKVVFFIQHYLKLVAKYSDLEILEACGKLDTNCFEIRQNGANLRAMYRTACLISHDCMPNTKHTFDQDYGINIYATSNIAKGSVISATYTHQLWSTLNRREHLWMSKCFWCQCRRCEDPTECGSYLSAQICKNCGNDKVVPENPLDRHQDWRCEKCSEIIKTDDIKSLHSKLTSEIRELDRSNPEALEQFVIKNAALIPETNQINREIQYGIVSLLKSSLASHLSNEQLLRKSFLCKQLLELADKIDPGMSKWRGQLLFDLQSSTVILTQRALNDGKISSFKAKEIFEESSLQLQESIAILSVEPECKEELLSEMKKLSDIMAEMEED